MREMAMSETVVTRNGLPLNRRAFLAGGAVLDKHMHVNAKTLATRIFPDSSGARPLQGPMRA